MAQRISPDLYDEIKLLLAQKVGVRNISRRMGVGRNTVSKINRGVLPRPLIRAQQRNRTKRERAIAEDVTAYKCPDCGNVVTLKPCKICADRAYRHNQLAANRLNAAS